MKIKAAIGIACAGVMAVSGSVHAEDIELAGSAGVDVVSAYVFRGGTINDEVNINPFAEVSAMGLTFGTWGNFNTDPSEFDEIDYYLSYDIPIENCPVGISVGYTEYTFMGTETLEADREISASFSTDYMLSPSLLVAYGFQGVLEDGLYVELGAGHEFEVDEDITVSAGAALGYEAGDNFVDNGFSHLTLTVGAAMGIFGVNLNYVVETDDDVQLVDEDFWVGVGVSL